MDVLYALDMMGLPVSIPSLSDAALCALVRAAAGERATVGEGCGWLADADRSDDELLLPPQRSFCKSLIVTRWRDALVQVETRFVGIALDGERGVQRLLMRRCREESAAARAAALDATPLRRLRRHAAAHLVGLVRSALIAPAPEEFKVALPKTALYGWCTSSRRGSVHGCSGGADEQQHYLVCPRPGVVRVVVLCYPIEAPCMGRLLFGLSAGGTLRLRVLLVLDLSVFAFDARRNGATASARQLLLARLNEFRRWHSLIRELGLRPEEWREAGV